MKKFFESLKGHAMRTTSLKKKKMKLLTKEQEESYENSIICYISTENFEKVYFKEKKISYSYGSLSLCNLKNIVPEKFL